jgi:hypothetical protein
MMRASPSMEADMEAITDIVAGSRWSRWRIIMWGAAAFLLILPAIAMQFTGEVAWDGRDFAVVGVMLATACGACELAARASTNGAYRIAAGIAVGTAFLTVWANLAVGMIGSEGNPYNLVFAGVIGVALLGSILVRFEALAMMKVMILVAVVQASAGAVGLTADLRGALFTMAFSGLWLFSALVFRVAARQLSEFAR